MIDPNYDVYPQTVFTAQASDADFFASRFPWPFRGIWLSDCCLVKVDRMRIARISTLVPPMQSTNAASSATGEFMGQEFTGMKVEIVHKFQGSVMSQDFPFSAYLVGPPGSKSTTPRLMKKTGKFRWFIGRDPMTKTPNLKDYCNAIEIFLDMMAEDEPGDEEISKAQHHQTTYQGSDDSEPIVIEDAG